jgi:hypothetical protein
VYSEATLHIDEDQLVWDTDGYYAFGEDKWKDVVVEADIVYQGGEIGIIPRLDSHLAYVAFTVGNYAGEAGSTTTVASLFGQISSDNVSIATKQLSTNLVLGSTYTIKAEVRRTNYKIYIDDALIFNTEFNRINNGKAAVYGSANTQCTGITISAEFPDGWHSNVEEVSGAIATLLTLDNGDFYIHVTNPSSTNSVELWQVSDLEIGGSQTLSFLYKGEAIANLILNTGDAIEQSLPLVEDWTRAEIILKSDQDSATEATIRFSISNDKEFNVNDVQLEAGEVPTTYIHNPSTEEAVSRGSSFITYPSKDNIVTKEGTISLWIKPQVTYDINLQQVPAILEYGDENGIIGLHFEGDNLVFNYGQSELSSDTVVLTSLDKDQWYHIAASWSSDTCSLYVNGIKKTSNMTFEMNGTSNVIRLGHSVLGGDVFNGVIDDLIIFSKQISDDEIEALLNATDPVPDTQQMILRATLNYAIGSFNKSIIEMTPSPEYGSPVIVTKEDGTVMQKVAFFDELTGEYQTYTDESFIYDGQMDYVRVGYNDIDEENFKITIRDYNGVLVGSPYHTDKNKVFMSLTEDEKKALRGQSLFIRYQPEDSYTVDFNIGQPDSFRVSIGKYDGQPLGVDYEGNRYSDQKLATMIELNPMLNPNHQGFMYIIQNTQNVSSFRAQAFPDDLPANGIAEALIVVEPLDHNGNFISYANLEVTAGEGTIIENHDIGSLRIRETAGRYMYRYRAPWIMFSARNTPEVADVINVIDKVSGMGIQIPLTLTLSDEATNQNEAPDGLDVAWDEVSMYMLTEIAKQYGKTIAQIPDGLGEILDFNIDGKIGTYELNAISEYKYTNYMFDKYTAVKNWYRTHT